MYVSATSMRLFLGRSTPAMRAILLDPYSKPLLFLEGFIVPVSSRPAAGRSVPGSAFVSALSLLVTRVLALHAHDSLAADHFAVLADLLDGCANLHGCLTFDGR